MKTLAMKEFREYTDIAFNILQSDTTYIRSKNIISDIFKISKEDRFETIIFRLTIIDSYYSTQMNKRLFGLDDLASQLTKITNDDNSLKAKSIEFIDDTSVSNGIKELFKNKYGIRKTGHDAGQAASLISKYLYFLTDYKFPIYDNLARNSYSLIQKKYPQLNICYLKNTFDISYFDYLKQLNTLTEINDYNKLDNLLWLIGKLTEGSFSLILNRERYLNLVQKINIPKGTKSKKSDELIRDFIKKDLNKLKDIFQDHEIKFLNYAFDLVI